MCIDNVNTTSSLSTRDSILSILFFACYMAIFTSVARLGNADKPVNNASTSSKRATSVLFRCSGYICINYHIRKCAYPNIVSNCLQHAYSFLLIVPEFLIQFTLLTILGNAHRPCKQYTNLVDNGLHHISLFFSDFVAIFTIITILGNAHRPCKLYLNIINNFTSCLFCFPDFFPIFSLYLHYLPY